MKILKVETFDRATGLTKFVNEMNAGGTKIEIQQILARRIADICTVYDIFYWVEENER